MSQSGPIMEKPLSALILDDDETFLKTLSLYTEKIGIEHVDTFVTADDVWQNIKGKSYDVLFLDWKLPGELSGLALFNRLRRSPEFSLVPILVVSGFVEQDDFRLLKEFPCTDLLEKPFQFQTFEEKVNTLWGEHTWYRDNVNRIKKILNQSDNDIEKALLKF